MHKLRSPLKYILILKSFNTISRIIQIHYDNILNYFVNRSTNAAAASFNAKIKSLKTNLEELEM